MNIYTGRDVDPINLRAEDIDIRDIAHALSNECRYNGMCEWHYSVAQHSVLVTQYFKHCYHENTAERLLACLLHDASEAYLKDIPRGLKYTPEFEFYRQLENKVQSLIYTVFGVDVDDESLHAKVKHCDDAVLVSEGVVLMHELYTGLGYGARVEIKELTPKEAKKLFVEAYQDILRLKGQL